MNRASLHQYAVNVLILRHIYTHRPIHIHRHMHTHRERERQKQRHVVRRLKPVLA